MNISSFSLFHATYNFVFVRSLCEKKTTICNLHVVFFLDCRKLVNWDTEITDLAGQEISVEHKEHIPFPPRSSLSHNFVSTGYFFFTDVHIFTHQSDLQEFVGKTFSLKTRVFFLIVFRPNNIPIPSW